jgi:hypothetical protein
VGDLEDMSDNSLLGDTLIQTLMAFEVVNFEMLTKLLSNLGWDLFLDHYNYSPSGNWMEILR